jgi:hypothetical protein
MSGASPFWSFDPTPTPELVVVVPTRARPHAARELVETFDATCTANTHLLFVVDSDDPNREEYGAVPGRRTVLESPAPSNMGLALACGVSYVLSLTSGPFAIGFMGDDHRPRTKGFDRFYIDALRELGTGIVYGDDLLQGERIPTQVAMTTDIVRALGHMAPPTLIHMYFDDYWKELGTRAGCIRYLPDVVVEHMHPLAGKAEWDPGYERVNAKQMFETDHAAYMRWKFMELPAEVAKVRALRAVAA